MTRLTLATLASGSTGNCFVVATAREVVLVDAGIPGVRVADGLAALGLTDRRVTGLVITHEHSDHAGQAGVVARRYKIPVYATEGTFQAAERKLGKLPSFVPVSNGKGFAVGDLVLHPFPTFHDAADAFGLVVEGPGGARVGVLTDVGRITQLIELRLRGCQAVVLEANYDPEMLRTGPYPWHLKQRIRSEQGHLSNADSAALVRRLLPHGLRQVLAAHLSQKNNLPAKVQEAYQSGIPAPERAPLALHLAPPDRPSVPARI